jgi:peptidoglycan/xylan/chitin deacetylase (PgdA/CDA1 family)/glycosyltransferase involved in cell wall biosynthesis
LSFPKRLLFIANDFPNPYEPTKGVFNAHMIRALAERCAVQAVAPVSWVSDLRARRNGRSCAPGVRVNEGVAVHHPRYYYTPKSLRRFYGTFLWWSLRKTIQRILAEAPPDAVLGYWAHPDGEVAVRAARQAGVPALIMVGGSDVLLLTQQPTRRRCIVRVLNEADAVVAVSQHLKDKLIELGVAPDKVQVVCRGVDETIFYPGDRALARRELGILVDQRVLLWVGRMVPVKGLDILLAACGRLQAEGTEFQLFLIGDGPLRTALAAQCQKLGLRDSVKFVGPLEHHRLADWYRAANVTVLPSRSEGVPNVLRESLACGTPFVASRVGGIPEIANGQNSRLVPPDDPAQLADAIAGMLDRADRSSFAKASLRWQQSAKELLEVIAALRRDRVGSSWSAGLATTRPAFWKRWTKAALTTLLPRRLFLSQGPARSGAVCLTFDDGPHPEHTPQLLDVLKREDVRATFFVVGTQAASHPELVRRIVAEGHAIGNHTYSHAEPRQTSAGSLLAEVQRTRDLLRELLGAAPTLFRPPHGKLSALKLWRLWRAGQTVVLWNVDPKDFARRDGEEIRTWFKSRPLHAGDVVLMHDNRPHAAAVIPDLVRDARARGLAFTTLEGCLS